MTIILYIAAYLFVGVMVAGVLERWAGTLISPFDRSACVVAWPIAAVLLVLAACIWIVHTGVRIIGGDKR